MIDLSLTTVLVEGLLSCQLVNISIEGSTTPEEFAQAVKEIAPKLAGRMPVLLQGRAPVWGYAMLIHEAHATPAVATFDPRIGYVIVQSHSPAFATGQILQSEPIII